MYYYCAKLNAFKLPELSQEEPAGGIIAASALPYHTLVRRQLMPNRYLTHRMLDPQLYLCTLDPRTAGTMVYKLATYPWFGIQVPGYDSSAHGSQKAYKDQFETDIHALWPRACPASDDVVQQCVSSCLETQLRLGCEALIAPSPLTTSVSDYANEARFLDVACAEYQRLRPPAPLYATIALSDTLCRNTDPLNNGFLQSVADQVAARPELGGAYIVIEQSADSGYVGMNEEVLLSLLVLTDDLARGAGKRVIVSYMGSFGAVASAAGAQIWSSGHYRSQRRMRMADQEENEGRSYPRFYSLALAGDIGVRNDMALLRGSREIQRLITRTAASRMIVTAIQQGTFPSQVPEWQYELGNIWPAAAHYNDVCCRLESYLDSHDQNRRIDAIDEWLRGSVELASHLQELGLSNTHTDMRHQNIWYSAFRKWRQFAGL